MSKLDEWIEKLPDDLKPWGRKWGNVLLSMAEKEAEEWIGYLLDGKTKQARKLLLRNMTDEQFKKNLEETNEALRQTNKRTASLDSIYRQMLVEAATILWALAKVALLSG